MNYPRGQSVCNLKKQFTADAFETVVKEDNVKRRNGGVEDSRAVHRIKRHEKVQQHANHVHLGNADVVLGVSFQLI